MSGNLTIHQRPARAGNYTRGRQAAITQITAHHIVGDAAAALHRFQNTADGISSTYVIGSDGTIYQCVREGDTPHTDGNWQSNSRSITIEHAGGHPNVPYTEAMMQASIQLCREIRSRHNITRFLRHRDIVATACPGGLDVERIIRESSPSSPPSQTQGDVPMSPQEEANAYQIVLNRPMEHGGSRRTGYKFIVDAQAEVQAQRQAVQNTITNQQNVINQLNATLAELRNLASQDALNDADVAARLDAAHARVADLTKQLEVMQVELAEATNNEPPAPKINPIIELLARLLRRNK